MSKYEMYSTRRWMRVDDLRLARLNSPIPKLDGPKHLFFFAGVMDLSGGPLVVYRYVICADAGHVLRVLEGHYEGIAWIGWMYLGDTWLNVFLEVPPVPELRPSDFEYLRPQLMEGAAV